nr:MAG TPA: hypothetical protein [Caudoviricetes sp.]
MIMNAHSTIYTMSINARIRIEPVRMNIPVTS